MPEMSYTLVTTGPVGRAGPHRAGLRQRRHAAPGGPQRGSDRGDRRRGHRRHPREDRGAGRADPARQAAGRRDGLGGVLQGRRGQQHGPVADRDDRHAPTRVCIIGAGSSGITAAQVLDARGIAFDCFEMGSDVGGNWRYDNDNGVSSAYRSLHINTSRQAMEYAAYPMPESLPDYPSHWQIAAYFDDYVDHFGLRDKITFRTEVVKVVRRRGRRVRRDRPAAGHRAAEPETRHYDHVLVANGHHWDPRWPEPSFPGQRDLPRRAGARPLLPDARPARGQAGGGPGHRQLGHRHRRRVLAGGAGDLPRDAPRRPHRAEVHVRHAHRPPHRLPAGARAVVPAEAGR